MPDQDEELKRLIRQFLVRQESMHADNHSIGVDHREGLMEVKSELHLLNERVTDAFPNGDTAGHRLAHELMIEESRARTEQYRELKRIIVKWGILGLLGWVAAHIVPEIWTAIKLTIRQ